MAEGCSGKRLLFLAYGSRGDVQPYVGLAKGLQAAGAVVRFLTNVNHIAFLQSFGLEAVGVHADSEILLREDPKLVDSMATGDVVKFMQAGQEALEKDYLRILQAECKETQAFQPDLLVAAILERLVGLVLSIKLQIPMVFTNVCSSFWASGEEPSPLNEPEWLSRGLHRLAAVILGHVVLKTHKVFHRIIAAEFPEVKLDLVQTTEEICLDCYHPIAPEIVGFSPLLVSRRSDWPADLKPLYTGFWVVREEEQLERGADDAFFGGDGAARAALERFLAAGEAPAYLGWGSMYCKSAEHMTVLAVRALMKAGLRGVVLGGWARLDTEALKGQADAAQLEAYAAERVLFVRSAPHEWLFPKCSVIVHHGGAGTTAAALRAGRPSIITPVWVDQFAHARVVRDAGVGISATRLHQITPEELAKALRRATSDDAMKKKAAELGQKLMAEDGVAVAVAEFGRYLTEDVATGKWKEKLEWRRRQLAAMRKSPAGTLSWMHRLFVSSTPLHFAR